MDLTAEEVRVLGCLIEKGATTPDQYPMSTNGLRMACNQATNREPVVEYSERLVDATVMALRQRGLARTAHGAGHRVAKHRHVAGDTLGLDDAALSVLAVLALRGPQTTAELKTRTDRYAGAEQVFDIDAAVDMLARRPEPLAVRLERRPGEREARVTHLLMGEPVLDIVVAMSTDTPSAVRLDRTAELEARVATLESDVADLRARMVELIDSLGGS